MTKEARSTTVAAGDNPASEDGTCSTTVAAEGNPAAEDDALDSENNPAPSGADTALGGGAKHTKRAEDATTPISSASAKRAEDATTPISSASIPENITAGGHALPNNWLMRIVLIWSGYAISTFAGNAASYSNIWFVTESTASPLALAALYVLAFLPMGILSPFGGVVADKCNRKAIIITCDSVLAISGVSIAIWITVAGPSFAAVALYCAVWGFVSGFRAPAFNATMPLLVPAQHLMRINSADTLLGSISMIAAPALGILLYTSFGLQASIVAGGLGSLVAVCTMFLAKLPQIATSEQSMSALQSLKEGASALSGNRGLLILTIAVSLGMLAYGPIDSLLPLMVSAHFNGSGFAASLVAAVMGAGMLIGAVVLMAVNPKKGLPRIIFLAAIIVGAGSFAAGCMPKTGFWGFVACIGVLAIACAWFNAPLMTLLQKGIPEEKLGRVMGLLTAMTGLAIPIGTAFGGVVAESIGTSLFFCVDGAFIVTLGIATILPKSVRALN